MKINKKLMKQAAIGLSTLALTGAFSTMTTGCFDSFEVLKPLAQVKQDATLFDANMLLFKKRVEEYDWLNDFARLKHNNNEPIYVYVDPSINDKTQGLIQQSLDYVEDIFSLINDKYTFEIVDKQKFEAKSNKTTIEYSLLTKDGFASGVNSSLAKSMVSSNLQEVFFISSKILLASSLVNSDDDAKILYTLNHELLHSFGFADLYSGSKDLGSFMNTDTGIFYELISPNDFRALYAAYGEKHLVDNKIDTTKVAEVNKMLDEYEIYYHNHIFKKITQKNCEKTEEFNVLDINKFEFNNKKFATKKKSAYVPAPWYNIDSQAADTEILINGETVDVNLYYYDELYQSCSGKVLYGDNYVLLTDLKIYKENYKETYYEKYDLYLYKTAENEYKVTRIAIIGKDIMTTYPINMVENIETINFTF